jgi:hypothetical protein
MAEELLRFGGITIAVHADAAATGGAFSVMEELPPLLDTPLHMHANEDEFFYAVQGEHVITLGESEHRLAPGEGIFAPRGSRTRSDAWSRARAGSSLSSRPAASRGSSGGFRRRKKPETSTRPLTQPRRRNSGLAGSSRDA